MVPDPKVFISLGVEAGVDRSGRRSLFAPFCPWTPVRLSSSMVVVAICDYALIEADTGA